MKNSILSITLLFIFSTGFTQNIAQWRGENRDGIYNETDLLKSWPEDGPELLWHYDELGTGHASATVTNDRVYTAGALDSIGYIFCFDMDGKLLWKKAYGKEWNDSYEGARSTPLFYKNKLYQMSSFGVLYCLNAENGELIWNVDLFNDYDGVNIKWGVTENLAVDGDKLFCTPGGKDANVLALNVDDGSLIWKCAGNGEPSAYCSPLVVVHNGRKILVTQTNDHILGIDIEKGDLLWKYEQTNKYSVHANTPLYYDGMVLASSGYGKGSVMLKLSEDGSGVSKVWFLEELDNRMYGLVVIDGVIYSSTDKNRRFMAVDWKTGKTIFSENIIKKGNIIYADGLIYLYSQNGEVALINPNDGKPEIISTFKVPYGDKQHWAHIVIKNKKLYVRHGNSIMVYNIAA